MSISVSVHYNGHFSFQEVQPIDYEKLSVSSGSDEVCQKLKSLLLHADIPIRDSDLVRRCKNSRKQQTQNRSVRGFLGGGGARLKEKNVPDMKQMVLRLIKRVGLEPRFVACIDQYRGSHTLDGLPELEPAYQFWVFYLRAQFPNIDFPQLQSIETIRYQETQVSLELQRTGISGGGGRKTEDIARVLESLQADRRAMEERFIQCCQVIESIDEYTSTLVVDDGPLNATPISSLDNSADILPQADAAVQAQQQQQESAYAPDLTESGTSLNTQSTPLFDTQPSPNVQRVNPFERTHDSLGSDHTPVSPNPYDTAAAAAPPPPRQPEPTYSVADNSMPVATSEPMPASDAKDHYTETQITSVPSRSLAPHLTVDDYHPAPHLRRASEASTSVTSTRSRDPPAETSHEDSVLMPDDGGADVELAPRRSVQVPPTVPEVQRSSSISSQDIQPSHVAATTHIPEATRANEVAGAVAMPAAASSQEGRFASEARNVQRMKTVTRTFTTISKDGRRTTVTETFEMPADQDVPPPARRSTSVSGSEISHASAASNFVDRKALIESSAEKFTAFSQRLKGLVSVVDKTLTARAMSRTARAELTSQMLAWVDSPRTPFADTRGDKPSLADELSTSLTSLAQIDESSMVKFEKEIYQNVHEWQMSTSRSLADVIRQVKVENDNLKHYEAKVQKLQVDHSRLQHTGSPDALARTTDQLQRNQAKLEQAKAAYEAQEKLLNGCAAAVDHSWVAFHSLVLQLLESDFADTEQRSVVHSKLKATLADMTEHVQASGLQGDSTNMYQIWNKHVQTHTGASVMKPATHAVAVDSASPPAVSAVVEEVQPTNGAFPSAAEPEAFDDAVFYSAESGHAAPVTEDVDPMLVAHDVNHHAKHGDIASADDIRTSNGKMVYGGNGGEGDSEYWA